MATVSSKNPKNPPLSKKSQVMNHLTRGRGLSPSEAKTKFGVRNLRATISDIREEVQQQIELRPNGRYFMCDSRPPTRTCGVRKNGARSMMKPTV